MATLSSDGLEGAGRFVPATIDPILLRERGGESRIARLIDEILAELQAAGRHALRVVDAGCGSGVRLIRTLVHARALGFVAIEGRGFDADADAIAIARWATRSWQDPCIGISFETGDITQALADEADRSVDILICARGPLERLPFTQRVRLTTEIKRVAARLVLTDGHARPGERR